MAPRVLVSAAVRRATLPLSFQGARGLPSALPSAPRRGLLTLAIESSCDDTCVAVIEKQRDAAKLWAHERVTCSNMPYRGVHPTVAVESHSRSLAPLIGKAFRKLPQDRDGGARLPDFISVTRGPGMQANLAVGLNMAKALAVAWSVPLLGVHHMQAHALTPRMEHALARWRLLHNHYNHHSRHDDKGAATAASLDPCPPDPPFPFLSLLVSGGHSLLVHSRSLVDHDVLIQADHIAVGNMIDHCAREILPPETIPAGKQNVVYGKLLENFAFPPGPSSRPPDGSPYDHDYDYRAPQMREAEIATYESPFGWVLTPPLAETRQLAYNFTGLSGQVQQIMRKRPGMGVEERRLLARQAMRLAFEHLAGRLVLALQQDRPLQASLRVHKNTRSGAGAHVVKQKTLVVSGGVASNGYLRHILRELLDARGYGDFQIAYPSVEWCTDNAAMIGWAGLEMYEAGYRTELSCLGLKEWPLGSLVNGVDGWTKKMTTNAIGR